MVGSGHGQVAVGVPVVLRQRLGVPVVEVARDVGVEAGGPVVGQIRLPEVDRPQVVDDVATAQDQHALLA